jgi:hypothetical protein
MAHPSMSDDELSSTNDEAAYSPASFADTLRTAITNSGLSLDRIQARLRNRGFSISVTALSYWQSGKRQPERKHSIEAVAALEDILGLGHGALRALLPPPRPRGAASRLAKRTPATTLRFDKDVLQPLLDRVGAPDALRQQHWQLHLAGLNDRCVIAADGGQRAVTTRAVFKANADGQRRWVLVYIADEATAPPPALHALRNCTIGKTEVDGAHGVVVAELLFDRTINRGETCLIEYSLTNAGPPFPRGQNTHWREFRQTVREYLIEVTFEAPRAAANCWQFSTGENGSGTRRRRLRMDKSHSVHAVALDFGPGVFGIQWD